MSDLDSAEKVMERVSKTIVSCSYPLQLGPCGANAALVVPPDWDGIAGTLARCEMHEPDSWLTPDEWRVRKVLLPPAAGVKPGDRVKNLNDLAPGQTISSHWIAGPLPGDMKTVQAAEKIPLNLIPLSALAGTARVFQHGAKKYAAGNFLLATDDEAPNRYMGALQRHVMAAQHPNGLFSWDTLAGLDEESGLPEIDHAIASLIMLRAVAIEKGALARDPGLSKLIS